MTAPNIVDVTTITGKTAVASLTTSTTAFLTNTSGSGMVIKVNAIYASNVDGAVNADLNLDLYRGGVSYSLTKTVVVPYDSTLDILSKAIYLEEGDALRASANANGDIQIICSYEEIS